MPFKVPPVVKVVEPESTSKPFSVKAPAVWVKLPVVMRIPSAVKDVPLVSVSEGTVLSIPMYVPAAEEVFWVIEPPVETLMAVWVELPILVLLGAATPSAPEI